MQNNDLQIQECNTIKQILFSHPSSRTNKQLNYIQSVFEKKVGYIQKLSNKIYKDNIIKLINSLSIEEFLPYQVLFNQGETGRKMYIILEGEVGILIKLHEQEESPLQINQKRKKIRSFEDIVQTKYKNYVLVATKKKYEHFGEIAIEQRIPRTATVITKCECVCAVLSFDSYQKLLKDLLEETVQMRQEIITKIYPFNELPDYALQQMLHNAEEIVFEQSTLLYKRYQQVKEIYIIISGEVLLQGWVLVPTVEDENYEQKKKKMKLINLGLMGKGTIIGDLELYYSLVLNKNTQFRVSQATTYEDSKLMKISFNTFSQIMQQYFQKDILNQYLIDKYKSKLTNTPQLISTINQSQFKSTAVINNTVNVYNLITRRVACRRITKINNNSNSNIQPIVKINNSKQNSQERGQRAQSVMEFKIKEYQTHTKQNSIGSIRKSTIRTEQSQENYHSKQISVSNIVRNLKNRVRVSKAVFQYFDNEYINLSSQLNRTNTEPKQ